MIKGTLVTSFSFALLALACGGSVATVDDGRNPQPTPTTTSTSPTSPSAPGSGAPVPSPVTPTPMSHPAILPVVASAYNSTCNSDMDCTAVIEATDCNGCSCPTAAINVIDLQKYNAALAAHVTACGVQPGCGIDCRASRVFCDTSDGLVGACKLAVQ